MSGSDDPTDNISPTGYGRPPVAHRFKPGRSGNPRGRPRTTAASTAPPTALTNPLAADLVLLGEAYRPIQLHEGGIPTTLSTVSAVYRSLALSGLKGNRLAAKTFVEQVEKAESRRRMQAIEIIDIATKYKNDWSEAIEWANRKGLPPPVVYPHPDDIVIGSDGVPIVVGPNDTAEQAYWDKLQARARGADESIREDLKLLKSKAKRDERFKPMYFDEIVYEHRTRQLLRFGAPDPATRRAFRYRRPTRADIAAFSAEIKAKYRLFAELTEAERDIFLWEVERYNRKLEAIAP